MLPLVHILNSTSMAGFTNFGDFNTTPFKVSTLLTKTNTNIKNDIHQFIVYNGSMQTKNWKTERNHSKK